ncbi:MAG TPA: 4a-hydroxytetrahydrobiopterin dehydratase [Sandaracinaceae bacterium LLY-WYZ-13_1]|nr:4a-hydroxytetrahydrobiopterin dehydratase [Sandaracinaceae bacterium LLY-WYZ-13_1]
MSDALDQAAIEKALGELPGWAHEGGKLRKRFEFGAFPEAISFITRIAFAAEGRQHHPEIFNVYSTVEIALTTHDAGDRVTEKDVDLAKAIEKIVWV